MGRAVSWGTCRGTRPLHEALTGLAGADYDRLVGQGCLAPGGMDRALSEVAVALAGGNVALWARSGGQQVGCGWSAGLVAGLTRG